MVQTARQTGTTGMPERGIIRVSDSVEGSRKTVPACTEPGWPLATAKANKCKDCTDSEHPDHSENTTPIDWADKK